MCKNYPRGKKLLQTVLLTFTFLFLMPPNWSDKVIQRLNNNNIETHEIHYLSEEPLSVRDNFHVLKHSRTC